MLLELALAVSLVTVSGDPGAIVAPENTRLPSAFRPQPLAPAPGWGDGSGGGPGTGGCANCGPSIIHTCGPQSFRCHFWFSPCDMYQRMPYWNKERGYYYFRPYHVAHTILQQERSAGSWGADPRNPYDNRFLDDVYDNWAADQEILGKTKKVEDLPKTPGMIDADPDMPEKVEKPEPKDEEKPEPEAPQKPDQGRTGQLKKFVKFR
jgi:hypothetical protein